jgi:hypothetical protein
MANWCWAAGTVPVVIGLMVSIVRDFLAGRVGVDLVAFVSMSGALALWQNLAGIVIAIMYAGASARPSKMPLSSKSPLAKTFLSAPAKSSPLMASLPVKWP